MNAKSDRAVLSLRPPSGWPAQGGLVAWSLRSPDNFSEGECESLDTLPAGAKSAEIRFWSPGEATLLLETRLPPMSRSRAVKALPYSLEERLLEDPADLHFAREERPDGNTVVGITSSAVMTAWLSALHAAGLQPASVCPSVLSVPFIEGAWSIRRDGEFLLVRTSCLTGRAVPWTAGPPPLLAALLDEARSAGRAPLRLIMWAEPPEAEREQWSSLGVPIEARRASDAAPEEEAPLNLLQGAFAPSWKLPTVAARLIPAAIMLALWGAGAVGATGWRLGRLAGLERRQRREMVELLRRSFPELKPGPDPAGQLARELAALRARGGRMSSGDLLPLLDRLAAGLAESPTVQLRGVEYADGAATATILASDLAAVEQLKQSCANSGLNAEITSAAQSEGKTQALLRISPEERHASR